MALTRNAAVFLDKDGTLVKDIPYNTDVAKITLEPGVAQGLRRLSQSGFSLVVVSNQSGIARGFFEEAQLQPVIAKLGEILRVEAGAALSGFYYCPHYPEGRVAEYALECACRKPKPGMILTAAQDLGVALEESWMVGDILNDVEAGKRAGCRTILIANGNETEWKPGPLRMPDFIAADLSHAADIILQNSIPWQEKDPQGFSASPDPARQKQKVHSSHSKGPAGKFFGSAPFSRQERE